MDEKQEEQITLSVEVATVIEMFIEKMGKLERRVEAVEAIVVLQQEAIRMLGDVSKGHQKCIEAIAPEPEPEPETPPSVPPVLVN